MLGPFFSREARMAFCKIRFVLGMRYVGTASLGWGTFVVFVTTFGSDSLVSTGTYGPDLIPAVTMVHPGVRDSAGFAVLTGSQDSSLQNPICPGNEVSRDSELRLGHTCRCRNHDELRSIRRDLEQERHDTNLWTVRKSPLPIII